MQLSESVAGCGFKFHDYATSVGIELKPVELKAGMSLSDMDDLASLADAESWLSVKRIWIVCSRPCEPASSAYSLS